MAKLKKIFVFGDQQAAKILAALILVFTIIFFLICRWKYAQFGYDGLDLAIFNQVFFNTVHGHWFAFSIHPHSYLGDHAEFIILLLAPLYALWQSPLCLLLLQSLIIALCTWPLFLIAKNILSFKWAFFISCLWLISSFLQNMALYEFHILPFAMFTLLWMFYFWQTEKFKPFLLFLFLSLLIREDVSLVIIFFGIFSYVLKRRQFKWSGLPFILGIIYFGLAMLIIDHFTPTGSYKYLELYSWLGATPWEMIKNIFLNPFSALRHIATYNNLSLLAILAFIFLGLNFLAWVYLIPIIPILIQIILGGSKNSLIVLQTHYSSLLVVFGFISLIYGLQKLFVIANVKKIMGCNLKNIKELAIILLFIAAVYFSDVFGPLSGFLKTIRETAVRPSVLQNALLKEINADQPIAASYNFLPNLSNRVNLYSLYYVYVGHKQFSQIIYKLPANTEIIAADFSEPIIYWARRNNNADYKKDYQHGAKNWFDMFQVYGFKVVDLQDTLALLKKQTTGIELYSVNPQEAVIAQPLKINLDKRVSLLGVSPWTGILKTADFLPLSFYFTTLLGTAVNDYQFRLTLLDKDYQELYQKDYPLGYGIFPMTWWPENSIIKMNYNFWLPPVVKAKNPAVICWEFFDGYGGRRLNRFGSGELIFLKYQPVAKRCLSLDKLL